MIKGAQCTLFPLNTFEVSESSSFVHYRYKLINAELIAVQLQSLLQQLCEPVYASDGSTLFKPEIYISIMAHFPINLGNSSQQVIVNCLVLDNNTRLDEIMEIVNARLKTLVYEIWRVKYKSNKMIGNLDLKSGEECKLLSDLSNELCNVLNSGIMLLNMMPDSECQCGADMFGRTDRRLIILITDGLMSISNPGLLESYRKSLLQRHIGLCVVVAEPPENQSTTLEPTSHLSYGRACISSNFKSATLFAMVSSSMESLGSLVVPRVHDKNFELLKYPLHRILLCSFFSHEPVGPDKSRHVVKHYAELKMPFSVPELVCLKIAGHGYAIRSFANEEPGIQMLDNGDLVVRLVRSCIGPYRLCYKIVGSTCIAFGPHPSSGSGDVQSVVTIYSESDQRCIPAHKKCVGAKTKQLVDGTVSRTIQIDRIMVSFMYSITECTCETFKSTVPVFIQISTGKLELAKQLRSKLYRDHSTTKFCMIWKPLISVHPSYWCWYLRDFKITLLLEHDIPLPSFAISNDANGFSFVRCRKARQDLNVYLQEYFPITLLENQMFLKFFDSDSAGNSSLPIRFCLLHSYESPSSPFFIILRFYFSYAASQEMCAGVLHDVSRNIPVLRCRSASANTLASLSNLTIVNQFSASPLSKKTKRCPVIERHTVRWENPPVSPLPVPFYRLPRPLIHELLINYDHIHNQPMGKNWSENYQEVLDNDPSTIQRNALSRFFHRKVWIRTFADFENNPINVECVEAIISTIIGQRLSKGFHFAQSNNQGVHVLFNEFALMRSCEVVSCFAQYVVFPIQCSEPFFFSRLLENRPLKADKEIYFISECWLEPQNGDNSTGLNTFDSIADQIKYEDDEIFKLFMSLEYLLPCRVADLETIHEIYVQWNDTVSGKTHSELKNWIEPTLRENIDAHDGCVACSAITDHIHNLPFIFDPLSLLDQSCQALAVLTSFATANANSVLLTKLYSLLSRTACCNHEYDIFKEHQNAVQWISRSLKRVESAAKLSLKLNAFLQNLKPNDVGWKCFLKPLASACLVIIAPTLDVLDCWNEHLQCDALCRERLVPGPHKYLPVFMYYISKSALSSRLWSNVSNSSSRGQNSSNSILHVSGSFSSLVNSLRSDTIVFDYTRSGDECQQVSISAQCNAAISHGLNIATSSPIISHATVGYKALHQRKRNRSRSSTAQSLAEEEALDVLYKHCNELRENFDNILISGIFECCRRDMTIERSDLEFALSICQETSNELILTDMIRLYCTHMMNFPELSSPALHASIQPCKPLNRDPIVFRQRLLKVINQYFQPVNNCSDIFYYSYDLPSSKHSQADISMGMESSQHQNVPFFVSFSLRFICRSCDKIIPFDPNLQFPLCITFLLHEMDCMIPSAPMSEVAVMLDVVSMVPLNSFEEAKLSQINKEISTEQFDDDIDSERTQSDSICIGGPASCNAESSRNVRSCLNYIVHPQIPPYVHLFHPSQRLQYLHQHPHYSVNSPCGSFNVSNISPPHGTYVPSRLKKKRSVMARCMRELNWVLDDEFIASMLSFTISLDQINHVADHILKIDTIGKRNITRNCRRASHPLKFIMGVQPSFEAFLQELQLLTIQTDTDNKMGRCHKLLQVTSHLYVVALVSQEDTDEYEPCKRRHSWCRYEHVVGEFRDRKRFRSDPERVLNDRLFTRSSCSVDEETMFQDVDTWMSPKILPGFWLLIKFRSLPSRAEAKDAPTHFADILLQIRDADVGGSLAEEANLVFNKLLGAVESICLWVNKKMILIDLEDTRMCAPFLVPDEDEGNLSSTENVQEDKYLAAKLDLSLKPGQFACDLQWTVIFTLHPRLRTMNVKHTKGFATVENALHSFIIYNRRNMFVYRRIETASIYYMIVKENYLGEYRSAGDAGSTNDISNPDSLIDFRELKYKRRPISFVDYENMLTHSTMEAPTLAGSSNRINSVAIHVYGLNEPDQAVKDHIIPLVSKRLDAETLAELLEILQRNSKCRLYADDVQFIKRNQDREHVYYYAVTECENYNYISEYMHYLKQALSQFLIVPNYSEDAYSPNRLTTPTLSYNPGTYMLSGDALTPSRMSCPSSSAASLVVPQNDLCFCFIHTIYRAVGIGNQGVAWIEAGICDCNGLFVNLQHPSSLRSDCLDTFISKGREGFIKWMQIRPIPHKNSSPYESSRYTLKLRIWKRGELDVDDLMSKVEPCLTNAMILLLTEYMVLSDPFPAIITMDSASPRTPTSRGRSSTASPEFAFSRKRANTDFCRSSAVQTAYNTITYQDHPYYYGSLKVSKFLFILEWLDFANSKYDTEFKKVRHALPYDFLVLRALDQFIRWLRAKIRLDIVLYHRSSDDEYVICDDNHQFIKKIICSLSTETHSVPVDIVVMVRDIDLWIKMYSNGTMPSEPVEESMHYTSCYCMRYEPIQCDQKECRFCVPRQSFVILHVLNDTITLYCYNWSSSLSDAVCSQMNKICRLHARRGTLLTSILLQQLNFFNLNIFSINSPADSHDMSSVLVGTTDQCTSSDVKKNAGNALTILHRATPSVQFENRKIGYSDPYKCSSFDDYLMIKRALPIDIVAPVVACDQQPDPVSLFGKWALELKSIYHENYYCEDKLRTLYESWLVRQKAPITVNTLNILKQNSRCLHSVATPLLFYNNVRECIKSQLSLTLDSSAMPIQCNSNSPPTAKSKFSSELQDTRQRKLPSFNEHRNQVNRSVTGSYGLRSFSAIVKGGCRDSNETIAEDDHDCQILTGDDMRMDEEYDEGDDPLWRQDMANLFFQQYQNYLSTAGFSPVVITEGTSPLVIQKTIRGVGIVLIEMVRSSEELGHFFVVKVYFYEHEPNASDILLSTPSLEDAGDRIRDITHFNSFTYDFHLRLLYQYLVNQSKTLTENFPVIVFLHDFLTYYADRPIYARNIAWQEDWYIDIQAMPADVFEYIIVHVEEYGIDVRKMNMRYESPSFILHSSQSDPHFNVCRLAYFPSPQTGSTCTLSEINDESILSAFQPSKPQVTNRYSVNSVKITAFTIMMHKSDLLPLANEAHKVSVKSSNFVNTAENSLKRNTKTSSPSSTSSSPAWEASDDIIKLNAIGSILPVHSTFLVTKRDETVVADIEHKINAFSISTRAFFQNIVSDASKSFLRDRLWTRLVQWNCNSQNQGNNVTGRGPPLSFNEFEDLLCHTVSNSLTELDSRLESLVNLQGDLASRFLEYITSPKTSASSFHESGTTYICLFSGVHAAGDIKPGRSFVFTGKSGTSQLSVYGEFEITEAFILIKVNQSAFSIGGLSIGGLNMDEVTPDNPSIDRLSRHSGSIPSNISTGTFNGHAIMLIDVVRRSKNVPTEMAVACVNAFVNSACYFLWNNLV